MDDDYASSDNEQDELMEDAEDLEAENDAEEENEDDDEDQDEQDEPDQEQDLEPDADAEAEPFDDSQTPPRDTRAPTRDDAARTSATPTAPLTASKWRPVLRQEYIDAPLYDIVPTMAAPQATSINAMAITPDLRYWITGGSDGYIRKYDGMGTINGKQQLTVAQRHPFVDSVVKAGILMSYWENEEPAPPNARPEDRMLSPVYSLAVHSQALWLLSGLESGGINLQSVRHDEGKRIHCLRENGHTNAVSVLQLAPDEKSVLSGSWDKTVLDWDLNNGQIIRKFEGIGGQISAIELRPAGGALIPAQASEVEVFKADTSFAETKPRINGFFSNNANGGEAPPAGNGAGTVTETQGSPEHESLFGSPAGSLFGDDNDTMGGGGGGAFGDDDDDFSRAMDMSLHDHGNNGLDHGGDFSMGDSEMTTSNSLDVAIHLLRTSTTPTNPTLLLPTLVFSSAAAPTTDPPNPPSSTFLCAAIDGTIRIWDRRVPDPVARIHTRRGVPPWCMGACWSPDGNWLYAGRRNGTVEEYSIHKATSGWQPERTLKFPAGSGAVSCVRPMANGRHLVCASHDILRLYDLREGMVGGPKHSRVPFTIVPGPPRAGYCGLYLDPTSRIMISIAGTRGGMGVVLRC
ncbi:Transcription factor spt8 [Collariella sp. IMI 366227]|nr:Transcription factor spt8 [Collariella sp. IMI 366227]